MPARWNKTLDKINVTSFLFYIIQNTIHKEEITDEIEAVRELLLPPAAVGEVSVYADHNNAMSLQYGKVSN